MPGIRQVTWFGGTPAFLKLSTQMLSQTTSYCSPYYCGCNGWQRCLAEKRDRSVVSADTTAQDHVLGCSHMPLEGAARLNLFSWPWLLVENVGCSGEGHEAFPCSPHVCRAMTSNVFECRIVPPHCAYASLPLTVFVQVSGGNLFGWISAVLHIAPHCIIDTLHGCL